MNHSVGVSCALLFGVFVDVDWSGVVKVIEFEESVLEEVLMAAY